MESTGERALPVLENPRQSPWRLLVIVCKEVEDMWAGTMGRAALQRQQPLCGPNINDSSYGPSPAAPWHHGWGTGQSQGSAADTQPAMARRASTVALVHLQVSTEASRGAPPCARHSQGQNWEAVPKHCPPRLPISQHCQLTVSCCA